MKKSFRSSWPLWLWILGVALIAWAQQDRQKEGCAGGACERVVPAAPVSAR